MKILVSFLLLALLVSACANREMNPHEIPSSQRLIFGRLKHLNGKENYTYKTTLHYETNSESGTFTQVENGDHLSAGYFWGLVGREVDHLNLQEITYSRNDHLMTVEKRQNQPIATVRFMPGPSPIYIGDIKLETVGNTHKAKLLDIQDLQKDAENYLHKNHDFYHQLTKSVLIMDTKNIK